MASSRRALAFALLALSACAPPAELVRPGVDPERNAADRAECEAGVSRQVNAEFASERFATGATLPPGPGGNPIPDFTQLGTGARGIGGFDSSDPARRAQIESSRQRADRRKAILLRECLEARGFEIREAQP